MKRTIETDAPFDRKLYKKEWCRANLLRCRVRKRILHYRNKGRISEETYWELGRVSWDEAARRLGWPEWEQHQRELRAGRRDA